MTAHDPMGFSNRIKPTQETFSFIWDSKNSSKQKKAFAESSFTSTERNRMKLLCISRKKRTWSRLLLFSISRDKEQVHIMNSYESHCFQPCPRCSECPSFVNQLMCRCFYKMKCSSDCQPLSFVSWADSMRFHRQAKATTPKSTLLRSFLEAGSWNLHVGHVRNIYIYIYYLNEVK